MQSFHTRRFLQYNTILKNTAHIALKKKVHIKEITKSDIDV